MAIEKVEYQDIELQEIDIDNESNEEVNNNFDLGLIADLEVKVDIKVGDASLTVSELNNMSAGKTFKLNQAINEPVQLILNNKVIGAGKLVVVGDHFGVEVIKI